MIDVKSGKVSMQEFLQKHHSLYGLNSGPLTESQTIKGLRNFFQDELRKISMKSTLATNNQTRYQWLCQHYLPGEQPNANPEHYHKFPFHQQWKNPKFYLYFFSTFFAILENSNTQFLLAIILVYLLHMWSHELYMRPIHPFILAPCYKFPIQPGCSILNFLQQSTFNSIEETYKTFTVFAIKLILGAIFGITKKYLNFRLS